MKLLNILCIFLLFEQPATAQQPINFMSFNIRLDVASDSLNNWQYRKDKVSAQVLFHETDILGVQEALYNQVLDLETALPAYRYAGVGRDDGKTKGEFSAIFYNEQRFELITSSTFWLSQTPGIAGSKSWDAAITRIVSWAKFRDKKSNKTFFVFNTHFDHIGKTARRESARLLLRAVDSLAGKTPAIVMGDFNAKPGEEPIQVILDQTNPHTLINTKDISATAHYGPTGTFNGFGSKETSNEPIDYIFVNNKLVVLRHATLSQSWQGRFSSDHFPVWARIVLN